MNNNLVCLFRACNLEVSTNSIKNISRPDFFSKQRCFKSFYNSFGNKENVDIIVVFDGKSEDELVCYIKKFNVKDIIYLNNIGNKESLIFCYNLAEKLNFDFVFFAEDDYLYLSNSYEIMMEGLESFGKQDQFITLYDHYNRYLPPNITGDVTTGHDYCLITKSTHWRSSDSTTGSVAMTKELFNKIKYRLLFHNIHDCAFYREMLGKGYRVFNCIPGKSTHINKVYASPLINWVKYNNSIIL